MGDIVNKTKLENASVDCQTLEDCVNGPAETKVTSRLGRQYWTLATIDSKVANVVSQADYALILIQDAQDQIIAIADTAQAQFDVKMTDIESQANTAINDWNTAIQQITIESLPALAVTTANTQTQQAINDSVGAKWYAKGGGYPINYRVMLDNGDIVKSTAPNNIANPNTDLTGWVKTGDASQIFDASGKTQQDVNNFVEEKTLNLLDFFTKSELSAYKADYTSVDILEAWQRATSAARDLNQKLSAFGKFRSASTLILNCAADLSSMVLESSATTIALDVRSDDFSYLSFAVLFLPEVTNLNKVAADNWVNTNATGIRLVNLNRCTVFIPRIDQFKIGLHEYATGTKGTAHNKFFIGQLFNNKINHLLSAHSDGSWVNENIHNGGSYNHASDEGENIADCHHLKIEACEFTINGNKFNDPSFENTACDFHVVNGGKFNVINYARWEVPAPSTLKVKYYCDYASASKANHGTLNEIHSGYEVTRIAFTFEGTGSAFCNATYSIDKSMINIQSNIGGHRYRNKFSANEPILTFYDAGTQLETATKSQATVQLGSKYLYGKRETDTYNRFEIDFSNGAVKFLSGTEATGAEIFGNSTNLMCSKTLAPYATANNSDLGHASRKWRNALLTGSVGFFNVSPPATQPTITGKKVPTTIAEQNAVLDSIVAALSAYGIVTDGRTT